MTATGRLPRMDEPQRFEFSGSVRIWVALLAVIAVALVVAGIVATNWMAIGLGVLFALLVALLGRQAFGPPQAYVIDAEGIRHVRGQEVLIAVKWEQVTQVKKVGVPLGRGGRVDQLAIDVKDLKEVEGGHRYRNTRKVTGRDIMLNLGPLKHSDAAYTAAENAWLAARARE